MNMKMKNTSHRFDINRLRSRHEHTDIVNIESVSI